MKPSKAELEAKHDRMAVMLKKAVAQIDAPGLTLLVGWTADVNGDGDDAAQRQCAGVVNLLALGEVYGGDVQAYAKHVLDMLMELRVRTLREALASSRPVGTA